MRTTTYKFIQRFCETCLTCFFRSSKIQFLRQHHNFTKVVYKQTRSCLLKAMSAGKLTTLYTYFAQTPSAANRMSYADFGSPLFSLPGGTATDLLLWQGVIETFRNKIEKLQEIKTRVTIKREEAFAGIQAVKGDTNIVEASNQDAKRLREARRNLRCLEQKVAKLDKHQQKLDEGIAFAEPFLMTLVDCGEALRKMHEGGQSNTERDMEMKSLREAVRQGKERGYSVMLMVTNFPWEDLD